jgi:hypothetical protein
MGSDRRLIVSLVAVGTLMAAACGTTVPLEEQQAVLQSAASGDGLSAGLPEGTHVNEKGQVVTDSGKVLGSAEDFGLSTGGSGGSSTIASTGGTSSTSGSGSTSTPTEGSEGTGGDGGTAGPAASGENGPGITSDTIKIGIAYADDTEEANAAIGAAGATQINEKRAWEAMAKYVNDHGGIGGRDLIPTFYKLSVTSTESYDQQDQEFCAHYTQDEPVFVTNGAFKTDNGISCLQKAGLVSIMTNGLRFKSNSFFQRYPTYLEFDGVDNDAIAKMYADNMKKLGLFDKGYKLGIVTWDDPEYANPTKETLIPRLKQLGIKVSDVAFIQTPDSGGAIGNAVAQVGNTAVQFKGDGITHVMFMDLGANLALFFMQAAQRQQYAPRYGMTSAAGNTALADLLASGGNTGDAREQLHDAVSIGWLPSIDVHADDYPSWAHTSAEKVCYQQMREGGVEMTSGNARALAAGVCDAAWTIQATLKNAGPVINQETWYRALAKSSDTPLTGPMGFTISPAKRAGLEMAAPLKFFDPCVCFRYVGDRFAIPS